MDFATHYCNHKPEIRLRPELSTRLLLLVAILTLANVTARAAYAVQETIPTSEYAAALWLREAANTINFNEDNHVQEVIIDYVPQLFTIGDLEIFEELEILHVNVTSDFLDEHMSGLARLKNLKELKFISCPEISPATLAVLHYLPKLERLIINDCPGINALVSLGECKSLKHIGLSDNDEFDFNQLKHLERLASLTSVDLKDNPYLENRHLKQLARASQIVELDVSNCQEISDEGLIAIANNKRLTRLTAYGCDKITGSVLESLTECPLEDLNLSYTSLTDETIQSVAKLTTVKDLALSAIEGIAPESLDLFNSLKDLERLYLQNMRVEDEVLARIASEKLTILDLTGNTSFSADGLVALPAASSIVDLYLDGMRGLNEEGMAKIATKFTNLKLLDLSRTRVKPSAMAPLDDFAGLESLILRGCRFIDDSAMENIAASSSIKTLDLGQIWKLTDEAFVQIAKMESLTALTVGANKKLTGSGFVHLRGHKSIEVLRLYEIPKLTPESIRHFHDMPALNILHITDTILTDLHLGEMWGLPVNSLDLNGSTDELDDDLYDSVMSSLINAN